MKANSRIPFMDTILITKDMCELVFDEPCNILFVPVNLESHGILNKYIYVVVCKKGEEEVLKEKVKKSSGMKKKDFKISNDYCHITTIEPAKKRDFISFDANDDYPIKASFDDKYSYIDNFFRRFINFRNNLINNNEKVKSDDIYQYFSSVVGFSREKRKASRERIINSNYRK